MHRPAARNLLVVGLAAVLLLAVAQWWRTSAPPLEPVSSLRDNLPTGNPATGTRRRPLPPPALAAIAATESAPRQINLDEVPRKVPPEVLETYLERNGRSAGSLVAAVVVAEEDEAYLGEAAQRFPNDPLVQFTLLYKNLFPEQRREWLDRFMTSAPDNALPAYLSAREHLKAGDTAAALRDLQEASRRPRYIDYSLETMLEVEQLSLQSGASVAEAKVGAFAAVPMPQLVQFKQLGQEMLTLREQYLAAGDPASGRALEQMVLQLADLLTTGEGSRLLISQLVGVAIERRFLEQLPPEVFSEVLGMTPAQRVEELSAWKTALKKEVPDLEALLSQGSEAEVISYFDRLKSQGELAAIRWWQTTHGRP